MYGAVAYACRLNDLLRKNGIYWGEKKIFMTFELHPDLKRDGIPVGRFPLCLVLLINDRSYPWFVLVPERENVRDTIDLKVPDYERLWKESRVFGGGIMQVFSGEKLNVAALGNVTPQLHVHHIVRFSNDPAWPAPIWGKQPMVPYDAEGIHQVRDKLNAAMISGFEVMA